MPIGPVMLDLESLDLAAEEFELLQHPLVGGVIFFARNYESPAQIQNLVSSIRNVRPELLIAVDQEGGRVQRFKEGFTRLPAMQQFLPLYRKNPQATLTLVSDGAWLMASELLAVGVDFSFAPVLDLDDCHCEVIANRSFSPKSEETIALAKAWMDGMHEAGMSTTGKHFPGHGQVAADSHLALPIDNRQFSEIEASDLQPFAELSTDLDAIMPAHILFPEIDKNNTVGFSSHWLQTVLRKQLGFNGVIFSDDLTMEGAASGGGFIDRAQLALTAGCDMVLICNHRLGAIEVLDGLGDIDHSASEQRLMAMKTNKKPLVLERLQEQSRWKLTNQFLSTIT